MRRSLALLLSLSAAACAAPPSPGQNAQGFGRPLNIIRSDGAISGIVRVAEAPGGVTFGFVATGLPPGIHGVHVHETGRCDPPGFLTAGEHWNPKGRQHGFDNPKGPHLGDLGNITVGPDGRVAQLRVLQGASLTGVGGVPAMLDSDGAALVIHLRPDDNRTDPSGNSGPRLACAVITR